MRQKLFTDDIPIASVSRHRREIMGVAILGIMLFHGRAVLQGGIVGYLFAGVKLFMQIGVDIFFLLSGFGCFHSLRKSGFLMQPFHASCVFYQKRLRRILPKYLLVVGLYCILFRYCFGGLSRQQVLENYSLITFFMRGTLTEWFIASILVLYFITPLLFLLLNAKRKAFCLLMGFAAAVAVCISLIKVPYALMIVNEIFFTRIPVYMSGLLLGKKLEDGLDSIRTERAVLIFAVFLAAYGVNRLVNSVNEIAVERLLFCPLAIAITFFLASAFEHCQPRGRRLFSFFGGITLELYLVHEKLIKLVHRFLYPHSDSFLPMLVVDCISFLASVGTAVLIHRLFLLPGEKRGTATDRQK